MSEHGEQVILFEWAKLNEERVPALGLLFAIPNGAKLPYRGKGKKRYSPEALRLKAEGLKPGVPDVFLAYPNGAWHGLFIEMKFGNNKPTENQKEWLRMLRNAGYYTVVPYGFQQAKDAIISYLGLRDGEYIDML